MYPYVGRWSSRETERERQRVGMPGATVPPAYLVEHTGRGLGGKVAATRALRLCAVTAELPRRLFRRVLVEEEDCRAGA